MYFPVDPLIPNVVCVLQYQRTHLLVHIVRVCPKVQFQKKTGIFDDGSINGIDGHILERKMGGSVYNTCSRDTAGATKRNYTTKSLQYKKEPITNLQNRV